MPKPFMQPWRLLASRLVFEHPWLRVFEDTVELPSGTRLQWLRIPHERDTVQVICVDDEERVLVGYQYNHPPGRVVDEFPGGGVGPDEEYEAAARRELLEETGVYARQVRQIGAFLVHNRRSGIQCRVFVATDLEQRTATPEEGEATLVEWVPLAEMDARIRAGEIENGILLAAWSIFRASQGV